jgi:hypothetical protein
MFYEHYFDFFHLNGYDRRFQNLLEESIHVNKLFFFFDKFEFTRKLFRALAFDSVVSKLLAFEDLRNRFFF